MTNMKKIITSFFIVTLLCYSNLSIKTNAQVNDSQSVTLLNDELEMQPGEIKTFTLYETTETTNEKTATAAPHPAATPAIAYNGCLVAT